MSHSDSKTVLFLSGNDLKPEELVKISAGQTQIDFSEATINRVQKSRKIIDDIVDSEKVVYGVNTGFGLFQNVTINQEQCVVVLGWRHFIEFK